MEERDYNSYVIEEKALIRRVRCGMLDALQESRCRHEQREPPRDRTVPVLEAVWREAAEDHLGAAFIQHGDSVIVK